MTENRGVMLLVDGQLDERLVEQTFDAAADGPYEQRVRNALEAAIDAAEAADPERALEALWKLREDEETVERLIQCMDRSPEWATLALGAAFHIAHTELTRPEPDLRSRIPELLRWLQGGW